MGKGGRVMGERKRRGKAKKGKGKVEEGLMGKVKEKRGLKNKEKG